MDDQNTTVSYISSLSFNTTGWSNFKGNLINTILLSHSIMFGAIQEHFLLENNLYKLNQAFPDFEVFSLPAVKSNSQINVGRPSGGLSIMYRRSIAKFVTHIICPNSTRVHGVRLDLPHSSYVFINCYFPVDSRKYNIRYCSVFGVNFCYVMNL